MNNCKKGNKYLLKLKGWLPNRPRRHGKREKAQRLTAENWRRMQIDEKDHAEHCNALPERIELELTKACNFACTHCGTHGSDALHRRHNRVPPIETELVDQLARDVFPYLRRVYLVGEGEPFMAPRPLLLRLFRQLEQTSTFVDVATNGSLLDAELISALFPVLGNISISMDAATPETYYNIRRSSAFHKVVDTTRELVDLKKNVPADRRLFQIFYNYALRKSNCSELISFLRMAAELQVDSVIVRQLIVHFPSMKSETLIDKPEILNPLIEKAEREANKLGLPVALPAYIECAQRGVSSNQQVSHTPVASLHSPDVAMNAPPPKRVNCGFLWRCMNVRSTGHVFACNAIKAPLLGNLNTVSFSDMWNGETLKEMRRRLDTIDPHSACHDCWMREVAYFDAYDKSRGLEPFSLKAVGPPQEKQYNVNAFIPQRKNG